MTELEEFEAWCKSKCISTVKDGWTGEYVYPTTKFAWWGWQAGRASPAVPVVNFTGSPQGWEVRVSQGHAVPVAQDEREGYEDMRLTLIGQVHELLDIAERHCWTDDAEEKRRTQGAIDYARKVTAPYNYNGRRAALSASTQPAVSAEALRLDWLEGWKGHLHIDYFLRDGKGAYILRDNAWGRALGNGPDLRAAIDAAMGTPPADNKENGNV